MAREEEEGLSTQKKVVAGAAIGVAIPAAVSVAKKLMGDDSDKRRSGGRRRGRKTSTAGKTKTAVRKTATRAKKTAAKTTSRAKTRSGAGKTVGRKRGSR